MVAATTVLTSALRMYVVYREWRKRYRARTKERDGRSPKEERSCVHSFAFLHRHYTQK